MELNGYMISWEKGYGLCLNGCPKLTGMETIQKAFKKAKNCQIPAKSSGKYLQLLVFCHTFGTCKNCWPEHLGSDRVDFPNKNTGWDVFLPIER